MLQSKVGVVSANRGFGSVLEGVATVEIGPMVIVSVAIADWDTFASPTNVGNCAFSCTFGLASSTSYTAKPAPPVRETSVTASSVTGAPPVGAAIGVPPI